MYSPSLGQMVIATPHWLGCNLQLWADTQSLRQFSPQLSPWQLSVFHPFHLKLAEAVISAPSLIHFSNGVQIVDDCCCQKISQTHHSLTPPTSQGPFFWKRRVTRRGKCIYTVWIQPFLLLPEKLFNTRKAACELLMGVLFAVTWIMGRQAWHMYPSCSVHWVMQAEMPHIYHVLYHRFFSLSLSPSLLFSPLLRDVNRHHRGQEWPDLFCWRHHNPKGGPERHHLHFPRFQWPDIGSPADLWQQHGHQSGDLYNTCARQLLTLGVCSHTEHVAAPPRASDPLTLFQFV